MITTFLLPRTGVFRAVSVSGITASLLLAAVQTPAASTTVSVNFGSNLSAMGSQGRGVCSAVYDNYMMSSGVSSALSNVGIQTVRYPGGSYSDTFHWQTYTACNSSYLASGNTFDNFMNNVVNPSGAKAIITVNYGSNSSCDGGGDPNEAAAWVAYANKTKGWGIKYWEIGNEVGGNGYYGGSGWEYDLHYPYNGNRNAQPSLSPAAYGQNSLQFINAMKAQDSSIKCGIGFDTGNSSYNAAALPPVANVVDFVIIHWYPGGTDAQQLQSPSQIPGTVSACRSQISQYVGSRASQVEIAVTETGSGLTGGAGSIYAADTLLTWFENGTANVDYQELHSGFLSSANVLLGPAYGSKMAGILAGTGDTFVSGSSGTTQVAVHAVKKTNGHYAVMLLNKDPNNSYTVTVNVNGATLASSGTRYDCNGSSVSQSTISGIGAASFTITIPAYNLSVVDVAAGSSGTVANGTYKLIARHSGKSMDAYGWGTANGTQINQWTYGSGNNQKWTMTSLGNNVYKVINVNAGKSLDINGWATANGTKVQLWDYSGGSNQQFAFAGTDSGYYRITPQNATGSCLDVNAASTADGALVQLWNYGGGYNQQWSPQAP